MGPSFFITLAVALALLVTVIVLAALLSEAGSESTTYKPVEGVCKTAMNPLDAEFMARLHRETRAKLITTLFQDYLNATANGLIYLVGGSLENRYDTDVELPFRQESNFLYVTGVTNIPDCSVLIDLKTNQTTLFVPVRGATYALWNGIAPSLEQIKDQYGMDHVYFISDFEGVVTNMTRDVKDKAGFVIYTLNGVQFPVQGFGSNTGFLQVALRDSRAIKTEAEIQVIKVAIAVSSDAHVSIMQLVKQELYEYSVASSFISYSYLCSLQFQAYNPIVGAGYHSAILHYTANTDLLTWRQDNKVGHDNILLLDAGAEYYGYGADITRTYPISGKFNNYQKGVYNAVLSVQSAVMAKMRPGVQWSELQNTTSIVCCDELKKLNLVVPTLNCSQLNVSKKVVSAFLPHGVGHHLGLDVHDSWIVPNILEEGMILTVEPGIYFNEVGLANAFQDANIAPYLIQPEVNKYLDMEFGGVRIEDDVLVVRDGIEILSTAPRSLVSIEQVMSNRN